MLKLGKLTKMKENGVGVFRVLKILDLGPPAYFLKMLKTISGAAEPLRPPRPWSGEKSIHLWSKPYIFGETDCLS